MPVTGSIVISNNYIGVLVETDDKYGLVRDSIGRDHIIPKNEIHEICNPSALALLFHEKLMKRLKPNGETN